MPKRQHSIRKMVTFDPELWDRISDFRFCERINTETEAVRILIEAGLKALNKKDRSK
jgi:hypothetical protein